MTRKGHAKMSEHTTSVANGRRFTGFVSIREQQHQGMITLRGDLHSDIVSKAIFEITGCAVPAQRCVERADTCAVAWMSPDELLIFCPYSSVANKEARLSRAVAEEFATVVNVSDARAVFDISGPAWRDALAKLCPVDFVALTEGEIRRTRAAQVAAAIWVSGPEDVRLVCFRSVSGYVFDLLCTAAAPGSEPALYG